MNELNYQVDLLKAMNQKLNAREKMYTMICEASQCAYLYFSYEKNQIVTMGRWQEFFDFDLQDIKDLNRIFDEVEEEYVVPLREVIFLEKSGRGISAMECRHKGDRGWYSFRTTVDYDNLGNPQDKLIVVENTTKLKTQRDELVYMAHFDTMTGLYNRNYFVTTLHDYMTQAERERNVVSVMVIDIDDFKKVNDGMGMIAGDELIQLFGGFLKELVRENVFACHLNHDVFCIAIYDPTVDCNVEQMYQAIRKRTQEPFVLSTRQNVNITVSIGVADFPEAASTPLELINCAEIVMYRSKSMGKNAMQYFNASILNDFLKNVELDNKLREAAFHNNFELNYQPQFFTGDKRLRGVEALIRWRDEQNHPISPSVFIPIAEKNGCIIPIGDWVIEESIRTFVGWKETYKEALILSINISAVQYNKPDFVDSLMQMIRKHHVDPREIEIEITESVLIEDFEKVIDKLKVLRGHGIRVSLDDFGTGFSSLSYLKKLPIDTLKIDKSFIDTVLSDSATRIITESIINMVKSLGIESIAEGVEEQAQYDYLHAIGCDMIQGFLLGKPQTAADIETLLKNG